MSGTEKTVSARRLRYTVVFAVLAAAILIVTVLNINTGSVHIPAGRILRILFTGRGETSEVGIIWKIRMPSPSMAAAVSAAWAAARITTSIPGRMPSS